MQFNQNSTRQNMAYMRAVKQSHPELYRHAVNTVIKKSQLHGLGTAANYGNLTAEQVVALQNAEFANMPYSPSTSAWADVANQVTDFLKQTIPVYLGVQQAQTCLDINKQRAIKGLPPIDCAGAGLTPQVNVGVSKEIQTLAFAALGIGALYLFTRRK